MTPLNEQTGVWQEPNVLVPRSEMVSLVAAVLSSADAIADVRQQCVPINTRAYAYAHHRETQVRDVARTLRKKYLP